MDRLLREIEPGYLVNEPEELRRLVHTDVSHR